MVRSGDKSRDAQRVVVQQVDGGERPSLDYPCEVDIKVFALAASRLAPRMRNILGDYLAERDILDVSVRDSSKGKYQSFSCKVFARDLAGLDRVFAGLSGHPDIVMVI